MSEERSKARRALPPSPDFVTIRDVAAYCCVDESTVSRGVRNRTWPFHLLRRIRIGNRVLFTRASYAAMGRAMRNAVEAHPSDVTSIGEGRRRSA